MSEKYTLLLALEKKYPESSRNKLRGWIQEGRVEVDGEIIRSARAEVTAEQTCSLRQAPPPKPEKLPYGVRLLHKDKDLVVVDKPAGLLSVAKESDDGKHLHGMLKRALKPSRVFPVHRLDRDTSGVLLFALSDRARLAFREMFACRALDRLYVAVVEGIVEEEKGTWNSLLHEGKDMVVRSRDDRGKRAITHYTVLQRGKRATLLELRLETGRKNQIRVHAADAGHPVVGDAKYGSDWDPVGRLCLHAASLSFIHPMSDKKLSFQSAVPSLFRKVLNCVDA